VRRACIDIGSNTIRLLVADCDANRLVECHRERVFTRLGEALGDDGRIPPEKLAEVSAVVSAQLAHARRLGATEVRCVATAAVRCARNGDELIERLRGSCGGLVVELLTAEDEARLAFRGALRSLGSEPGGPVSVIDVGGGSSELVVGTPAQGVTWWVSFPLGSSDIARDFLAGDPPSAGDVKQARDRVRQALTGIAPPPSAAAIAIGADSLGRLVGPVLDDDAFRSSLQLLFGSSRGELGRLLGIEIERLRLLPAGLLILEAVSKLLGRPLQVISGGLREGLLLE
jgi:exopolyphosphatase/guanosine-5'-triphosphate,3'-diphosphate pyrophosphatase